MVTSMSAAGASPAGKASVVGPAGGGLDALLELTNPDMAHPPSVPHRIDLWPPPVGCDRGVGISMTFGRRGNVHIASLKQVDVISRSVGDLLYVELCCWLGCVCDWVVVCLLVVCLSCWLLCVCLFIIVLASTSEYTQ